MWISSLKIQHLRAVAKKSSWNVILARVVYVRSLENSLLETMYETCQAVAMSAQWW